MWREIVDQLKGKKSQLSLVLLGGLIVATIASNGLSGKIGQLAQLSEGTQICFSRVGQSFTARMLGNMQSPYLQQGFVSVTEECVGDVIVTASNELKAVLENSARQLNMLASNIHWFHEKVMVADDNGLVRSTNIDVENRFAKLEGEVEEFIGAVDTARRGYLESYKYLQIAMWMLALLVPGLLFWDYRERKRLALLNKEIEDEADNELTKNRALSPDRVRGIIGKALDQNRLVNCSKLFYEFSYDIMDEKPSAYMPVVYDEQKEIEVEHIGKKSNLNAVFSNVTAALSGKLFSQEIILDIDIAEDDVVQANSEDVEQAIYYMISDTIRSFSHEDVVKRILVSSKRLGGTTLLSVEDTTTGFGESFISDDNEISLDLKICREMAKDFSGTLVMENLRNSRNEIKGRKLQLVFKSAPKVDYKVPQKSSREITV